MIDFEASALATEKRIQEARGRIGEKHIPTTCRSWNFCSDLLSLPSASPSEWGKKKILDVGSGDKFETPDARFPGAAVHAVDPLFSQSTDSAPIHTLTNKAHILRRGTIIELPYDDNSFDYVISTHCIQHIDQALWMRAHLEMLRVMKPEGEVRMFPYVDSDLQYATYGLKEAGFDWEAIPVHSDWRSTLAIWLPITDNKAANRYVDKALAWRKWHDMILPHDLLRDDYDPVFSFASSVNDPSAMVAPLVNNGQ